MALRKDRPLNPSAGDEAADAPPAEPMLDIVDPATHPVKRASAGRPAKHKFTAILDDSTDHDFEQITRHVGEMLGRIAGRAQDGEAGGRYPSRADVLRAWIGITRDFTGTDLRKWLVDRVEADIIARREQG